MKGLSRGLAAVAAALALAALAAWRAVPAARDLPRISRATPVYLDAGENLLHRHLGDTEVSLRMPMYGVFEALALDHAGPRVRTAAVFAAVLLQLALLAALVLLGGSGAGAAAAVLAFSVLGYGAWSEEASLQPFFAVLVTLAAGAAAARARRPTPARSALAGAAVGASLLCRSTLVLLPPALALDAWLRDGRPPLRRWWPHLAGLLLAPYLFLAPWVAMNRAVNGRWLLLESESRDSNVVMGAAGVVTGVYGEWREVLDERPPQGGSVRVAAWAAGRVLAHPLRYGAAVVERLAFVLGQHPALYAAGLAALLVSLTLPVERALAVFVGYFLLVHCLMTVIPIYFIPLRPLLVAAAASAAARHLRDRGARARERAAALGERLLAAAGAVAAAFAAFVVALLVRYAAVGPFAALTDPSALARSAAAFPDDPWLRLEHAELSMTDDRPAAVADLEAARAARPGDAAVEGRLAWARFLNGDPEPLLALPLPDGAAYADEAEALKVLAALRARGRAAARDQYLLARDRYVHAAGTWREASLAESDAVLRVHAARDAAFDGFLASVATRWRSPAEAVAALRELCGLRPGSHALRHELARALRAAKDDRVARDLLRDIVREQPGDAAAWKDLGISEFALGRGEEARRALTRATALSPGLLSGWLSLGFVESASGRCPAARDAYRAGLAAAPARGEEGATPLLVDALSRLPCAR